MKRTKREKKVLIRSLWAKRGIDSDMPDDYELAVTEEYAKIINEDATSDRTAEKGRLPNGWIEDYVNARHDLKKGEEFFLNKKRLIRIYKDFYDALRLSRADA